MNCRLYEDDAHPVVEVRSDSLQSLRELGPPDLIHITKQPVRSTTKQVRTGAEKAVASIWAEHCSRQAYTIMRQALMLPPLPA